MLELVKPSFPGQARHRQHQARMRQYALLHGSRRHRKRQLCDHETNSDGDSADVKSTDSNAAGIVTAYHAWHSSPYSTIACNLLDPFDTLCEDPERLRQLLEHRTNPTSFVLHLLRSRADVFRIALAKSVGEPLFRIDQQTKLVLFQSFHMEDGPLPLLTNRTLFHAMSLLLTLEANDHLPNYETLHHRGQVLESLKLDLSHSHGGVPSLQTITAILMLISYEYRVQDSRSVADTAATHIRGLQRIMCQSDILASGYSLERIEQIQRALFWQDIIRSLATGTPRLLQLDNHDVFHHLRENWTYRSYFVLPRGFELHAHSWPSTSVAVLEDLNAMCKLVDRMHGQERTSVHFTDDDPDTMAVPIPLMEDLDDEGYPLCNSQANLEIRVVDLLSQTTTTGLQRQEDLIYRACLFAAYLCTYRPSAGLWEGHFAPEKCVAEILKCMADFTRHMSPWKFAPDISFWLLYVAGGLTKSQLNRNQAAILVKRYRCFYSSGYNQDWEVVEMRLKRFIWCEQTMKPKFYQFWQECQDTLTSVFLGQRSS